MSDLREEENPSVDALATVSQNLGTEDLPIQKPVFTIALHEVAFDFYLNQVDWSSTNIVSYIDKSEVIIVVPSEILQARKVAVGLNAVSTKFSADGRLLAVGTISGDLYVFEVETNQLVWKNKVQDCRIGCLTWRGKNLIFTGSWDGTIHANDLTTKTFVQLGSHDQKVCGMQLSRNKLVTGGDDNSIKIWDISRLSMNPTFNEVQEQSFNRHNAAIKALDFSPVRSGVIASGGGYNDGKILLWDLQDRQILKRIKTDKQITNLHWLPSGKEIVSTYGYHADRHLHIEHNYIDIWSFETKKVVQRFEGHKGPIWFSAMQPNKIGFVTVSSDKFMKFWKPT